jgi:hypothetical protein
MKNPAMRSTVKISGSGSIRYPRDKHKIDRAIGAVQ